MAHAPRSRAVISDEHTAMTYDDVVGRHEQVLAIVRSRLHIFSRDRSHGEPSTLDATAPPSSIAFVSLLQDRARPGPGAQCDHEESRADPDPTINADAAPALPR